MRDTPEVRYEKLQKTMQKKVGENVQTYYTQRIVRTLLPAFGAENTIGEELRSFDKQQVSYLPARQRMPEMMIGAMPSIRPHTDVMLPRMDYLKMYQRFFGTMPTIPMAWEKVPLHLTTWMIPKDEHPWNWEDVARTSMQEVGSLLEVFGAHAEKTYAFMEYVQEQYFSKGTELFFHAAVATKKESFGNYTAWNRSSATMPFPHVHTGIRSVKQEKLQGRHEQVHILDPLTAYVAPKILPSLEAFAHTLPWNNAGELLQGVHERIHIPHLEWRGSAIDAGELWKTVASVFQENNRLWGMILQGLHAFLEGDGLTELTQVFATLGVAQPHHEALVFARLCTPPKDHADVPKHQKSFVHHYGSNAAFLPAANGGLTCHVEKDEEQVRILMVPSFSQRGPVETFGFHLQ